ncbi:hypothetical protein B0H13DRAFT_2423541 [Mycena leptocephala]|nr:hypothetical protein B0H13DRAFT_2423541 [Mycena leptocephala]
MISSALHIFSSNLPRAPVILLSPAFAFASASSLGSPFLPRLCLLPSCVSLFPRLFFLLRFCVHPRLTPNQKGWPTPGRSRSRTASRPNPHHMRVLPRAFLLKLMNCNVDLPLRLQSSFPCPKLDDVWHPRPSNAPSLGPRLSLFRLHSHLVCACPPRVFALSRHPFIRSRPSLLRIRLRTLAFFPALFLHALPPPPRSVLPLYLLRVL